MNTQSHTPIVLNMFAYGIKTFVSTTQEKIDWYFNEFNIQPDNKFGGGAGKELLCDYLLNTLQNEDVYFSADTLNTQKSPTRWSEFLEDCIAFACLHSYLNKTALSIIEDPKFLTVVSYLGDTGTINSTPSAIH